MIRASLVRTALVLAVSAWEGHSQSPAASLKQALDLFNAGSYAECFRAVSGILQREPDSAAAYKVLGLDEYMLGRTNDALIHLKHATELAPRDSEAFYYLGRLHFSTDNPAAALDAFEQAIVLDGSSVRARNNLGQSLEALGRYGEAETAYQEAIVVGEKQTKPSQWPYYNLGLLYLHDGRAEKAVGELRKALACNSNFIEAKLKLAMALSAQNRLSEAQNLLEDSIRGDPGNAEAHYRLGMLLSKLGKETEAREQLELFEKSRKP